MSDETKCPACEGEGLLWIWPCNVCGGSGRKKEDEETNED
jgi:DnaJ-class molecular chaperone